MNPVSSALAMMTDAVIVTTPDVDPSGPRVVCVNEAFTRLTGYAPEEVVGKPLFLAHGVEPDHKSLTTFRRELGRGHQARGTAVCCRKDRSEYDVEWQMIPLVDEDGAILQWMLIYRDATPDQKAEREHLTAERVFRSLIDKHPDPICRFLPDTTLVFVNRAYAHLFHSTVDELTGSRFIDLIPEENRSEVLSHLSAIVPHRPSAQCQHKYVSESGQTYWHLWTTRGNFDKKGAPFSYQSVGTDITDHRKAEEELRKLSGAVEHSPSAIIIVDASGTIEYVNPAFTCSSGYSADEVIGRTPKLLQSGLTTAEVYGDLWTTIRRGNVWRGELCNRKKTGELYWDLVAIAPIRDATETITHFVAIQHEITEQKKVQRRIVHDAIHDSLTNLVNRREFERRLGQAVESAKTHGVAHVLCYLDLDQFKVVNDTAGHAAGDELLKQIRSLLKDKFRGTDTLARLGGDEFGLLLDNCSLERALKISEMLVSNLRDHRFDWEGRTFRIGVSIGLAAVTEGTENSDQAMAQADVACYAAKDRGRNRVRVYQSEHAGPARHHSEILRAATLRNAIEENRFCLYCQPIKPLQHDNNIQHHYEILVRMIDVDGQLILPESFIPAAERYGLMVEIDRWIIREAFRYCKKLMHDEPDLEISINLSGSSLSDEQFPEFLRKQLAGVRFPAERICFEITETAAIQNISQTTQMIGDIKKKGSRFALDDFGSGFSSFNYLKTLPVDYVKIDGRFVRDMVEDSIDHAMVTAINQVGHVMGIKTIAEYAHNEAILESLAALGVDYAQGYAVGAPLPLASVQGGPKPIRH